MGQVIVSGMQRHIYSTLCWLLDSYLSLVLGNLAWTVPSLMPSGTILCMCPANERRRYNVTSSPIGWVYAQTDPCLVMICSTSSFSTDIPWDMVFMILLMIHAGSSSPASWAPPPLWMAPSGGWSSLLMHVSMVSCPKGPTRHAYAGYPQYASLGINKSMMGDTEKWEVLRLPTHIPFEDVDPSNQYW